MNNKYGFLLSILFVFLFFISACDSGHLIRDTHYRQLVQKEFKKVRVLASARQQELFGVFSENLTKQEREGLLFLYAFMPLNDLAEYSGDFFLRHVKASIRSQKEMPWGKNIPDDIFLHYVLPYRVNNENPDSFRIVYYDEIARRIKGLTMKEAALEINHWCHEKVAYQPADIRTSSPMNTVKNARGRCGEESTFTVAALRTAGIPARQVYVPRWAHSDDNHAWVEVWVDGQWHYMGACEPEPALDMGWFTEPARRAMLIHTKAFGAYFGNEPVVRKAEKYAVINTLHRYAETKTLVVKVQDRTGACVPQASVAFQLYNYAEFYPLAILPADTSGIVTFTTGLGDLLVWAHKGDRFGYGKVTVSESDTFLVTLNGELGREYTVNLDMIPPTQKKPLPVPTAGRDENAIRLKTEDSIRLAYTATFFDSAKACTWAEKKQFPPERTWPLLVKSMGNFPEITSFLSKIPDTLRERALTLLEKVSAKDLRDAQAAVLYDHLIHAADFAGGLEESDPERFNDDVLAPRVDNEQLTAYRSFFIRVFSGEQVDIFRKNPERLVNWINQHIRLDDADNYYDVPLTPPGVFSLRYTDRHSRKIFFVSVCRTFGVPARIETAREVPQYWIKDQWKDVFFEGDQVLPGKTASLNLEYEGQEKSIPQYYSQFTLARFEEGQYHTLPFPYFLKVTDFPLPLKIDPGNYMLVTGNRKSDGSVLASLHFFQIKEREAKKVKVFIRKSFDTLKSWGKLPVEASPKIWKTGKDTLLMELTHGKGLILCWINPQQEPSRHIMNEIPDVLPGIQAWGGSLVFLLTNDKQTESFSPANYKELSKNAVFVLDKQGTILRLVREQYGKTGGINLPVMVVADGSGNLIDYMEGYHIGIGDHLIRVVQSLGTMSDKQ